MAETNKTESQSDKLPETDRLEAVKDLLFGQNVQEYRKEFREIKDLISALRNEADQNLKEGEVTLASKLESLEVRLIERIEEAERQLSARISSLEQNYTSKNQLAGFLQDLASKLKSEDIK